MNVARHISAGSRINYTNFDHLFGTIGNRMQFNLQRMHPDVALTVVPNLTVTEPPNSDVNYYYNIFSNNIKIMHVTFHMAKTRDLIMRAVHIKYDPDNGDGAPLYTREINGSIEFILGEPNRIRAGSADIINTIIQTLNDFKDEIFGPNVFDPYAFREKYLKYKNKYLQLKIQLGI
jgi:hypothetical protein